MSFIFGNIRKIIYENNTNSYKVGIFKVRETDDETLKEYINHTIYFIGNFNNISTELNYKLYGSVINHPKYGIQYKVDNYEIVNPSTNDEIISYLGSGHFEGIGLKLAKKIVDKFGSDTFDVIKNNYNKLTLISGISLKKAENLSTKFNNLTKDDELLKDLTAMGFSVNESVKIIKNYKYDLENIIKSNLYILGEIIDFNKVDSVYLKYNDANSDLRIESIINYSIKEICFKTGNTLVSRESLYLNVLKYFNNDFKLSSFNLYLENLIKESKIYEFNDYIMLDFFDSCERKIASSMHLFNKIKDNVSEKVLNNHITKFESTNKIKLNIEQKNAIKGSLKNNLFIISGGPGTGKTTIIKAIVDFYDDKNNIILLAPTGRSAKRMNESVGISSSTIHKFLKWNKEDGTYGLNINNKSKAKIVIIDEFSMVDMFLFSSLIDALNFNVKLILVGDANQLPSINPGNLLYDLLESENINKQYLTEIYRTHKGSYINYLASLIKERKTFQKIENYEDVKFIESEDVNITEYIKGICEKIKEKNIILDEFQVLAPMYKGMCGIDNLNNIMQSIFNPYNDLKREISFSNFIFREGDKVMNLINDVDNNIYNGDVGYIESIKLVPKKEITINFNGIKVIYETDNFDKLTLAYAISIHKSQGSEYDNVVVVLASSFKRMFYNKLIYTGISRAKKSLIILGKLENFNYSVNSSNEIKRITQLKNYL